MLKLSPSSLHSDASADMMVEESSCCCVDGLLKNASQGTPGFWHQCPRGGMQSGFFLVVPFCWQSYADVG